MEKINLIRVYIEKKYLLSFKVIMIFITLFFLSNIYIAVDDGFVFYKGDKRLLGETLFNMYVLKDLMISSLFLWLATGGSLAKEPNS
jgi:hypothetical protein